MSSLKYLLAVVAGICFYTTSSICAAQHVDIVVAEDNGKLVTGSFDWGSGRSEIPVRTFVRGFEFAVENTVAADNPGFNAITDPPAPYDALDAERDVEFDYVSAPGFEHNLLYWTGEGEVDFGAPPSGERLGLFNVLSGEGSSVDGADEEVPGFVLGTTGDGGLLHEHHQFVLAGEDEDAEPTEGIYVLALRFRTEGLEPSEPAMVLLTHGEDLEELGDEAAAYLDELFSEAGESEESGQGCRIGSRSAPAAHFIILATLTIRFRRRWRGGRPSEKRGGDA